jgi:actin related protein 2/3 complex subunit 2
MILLEYHNRIIQETLQERIDNPEAKKELLDVVLADFDGVKMHISNLGDKKNIVTVSISWKCIPALLKNGGAEDIKAIYGNMVKASPETGYDLSLEFDIDNIPGNKEKFPESISLLKRHLLAAPFKRVFASVEKGAPTNQVVTIQYRDEEAIYIKGEKERVTVIFSINFRDAGDQVLAKVFLQEFNKAISGAPSVSFSSKEPPGELKGVPGATGSETKGFVTFVLFTNHYSAKNADRVINNLETFRDYLHYHIKCSKGYLHNRMRMRVDALLQLLNRAKPTDAPKGEKKTAAGKTFVRK